MIRALLGRVARPLAVTAGVLACVGTSVVAPGASVPASASTARAVEAYDVRGTPVQGSTGPGGAPRLAPGQYTDTLANAGDDYGRSGPGKYYAVELTEGETPHLAATVVPPARPIGDDERNTELLLLNARLTSGAADDDSCSFSADSSSTSSLQGKTATTSITLSPGRVGGEDWPDGCPTSGTFFLFLSRNFGGADALPTEIVVRSEPPVGDTSGLPAAADDDGDPPLLPTPASEVRTVTGGRSFNSAPELTPGATYRDSIEFGEDRYFRVPVTWGQRLAFRFDLEQIPGSGSTDGPYVEVTASNPLRALLSDVDTQSSTSGSFLGGKAQQLSGGTTVPVRWTNRTSSTSAVEDYDVDGDYYLVLTAGYDSSGAQGTVPYTVTVDVSGDTEPGPTYVGGGGNGADSNDAAASSGSGWGGARIALVGGAAGIGGLAAVLLGVLLLRRRPRT